METSDRLKKIYHKLKIIETETSRPNSAYYCTVIARRIQDATELLKDALKAMK